MSKPIVIENDQPLEVDQSYIEFFLNSQSDVVELDLIDVYHPSFTNGDYNNGTTYKAVRNATEGIDFNGDFYKYYPFLISKESRSNDLDYSLKITFGDLAEITTVEMGNIINDSVNNNTSISIKYYVCRSDDLSSAINGPIDLESKDITWNGESFTLQCNARIVNRNKIGIYYDLPSYPSLRSFL